mgnify:CR=1 FL=1
MVRRLALTCVTMVFDLSGLVLISLCVGLLAVVGHNQALPYDNKLMNNVVSIAHYQTLVRVFGCVTHLLIPDPAPHTHRLVPLPPPSDGHHRAPHP